MAKNIMIFEKVVRIYKDNIYGFLLKTLRNPEDAEDLTQEVFLAFYKHMKNVKKDSYKAYLFQTAYHKALNHIKKQKQNKTYTQADLLNISQPEEDKNNLAVKEKTIKTALAKLPPKYQLILELQFYQNLSYKEIAKILNTSVSAVDSRLVRAKKKLKKIISQDFPTLMSN
ncbi:MAG: RNA polymerase sigma factor [Candidatus Cloacimonadota bacterium]|nr:RNA polymerase sigma factor [Candidatus Cloacimonadota bacterium]